MITDIPNHERQWSTQDFDFDLRIFNAQRPSDQRGGSRLMCLKANAKAEFTSFAEIVDAFKVTKFDPK